MSEVEIKKLSPLSLLMKKCKQNKTKQKNLQPQPSSLSTQWQTQD